MDDPSVVTDDRMPIWTSIPVASVESNPPVDPSTFADALSQPYHVYKRRWYIMLVYGLVALLQCTIWNQWGPIYASMQAVFDWNDTQLALLPFYGTVTLAVAVMPAVLLVEKIGLRYNVIIMSVLVVVAMLLRCIPSTSSLTQTVLINLSAIINGVAGCYTTCLPPLISARWFGAHERKFATSIGIIMNSSGVILSFLLGPFAVPVPQDHDPESLDLAFNRYLDLTYCETAAAVLLAVCIILYFPSHPPKPPSPSAEQERISNLGSIPLMLKDRRFWQLTVPVVFILGPLFAWTTVLGISLENNGISQSNAGWMGCWGGVAGLFVGLTAARLADMHASELKPIFITFTVLTAQGSVWILLLNQGIMIFSLQSMYFAVILIGAASGAILPLGLEYAAEICYPVDETTVTGLMGCLLNICNSAYLCLLFFPQLPLTWMTWALAVGCCLAVPISLFLPKRFRRMQADGFLIVSIANSIDDVGDSDDDAIVR